MGSQRIVDSNLIAHRGASHYAPENTIAAIELAHAMDAEWVEVDVTLTKDHKLVILHDATVDRTTNGTGRVTELTLDEIRELDAGSWFSPSFANQQVPTMEELVDVVLDLGLKLQLELKPNPWTDEDLLAVLALNQFAQQWPKARTADTFITSFSTVCMSIAARKMPQIARAIAVESVPTRPHEVLAAGNAQILHVLDTGAPLSAFEQLATHDIEFAVAIINDPDAGRALLAAGAQTLITDKPDLLQ